MMLALKSIAVTLFSWVLSMLFALITVVMLGYCGMFTHHGNSIDIPDTTFVLVWVGWWIVLGTLFMWIIVFQDESTR